MYITIEYYKLAKPGLIVLLYHKVTNDSKGDKKYSISIEKFKEQIRILKENGYNTILPKEIINKKYTNINKKSIILTFDDGTEDHFKTVYPILTNNGFKAVFFIVPKYLNKNGILTEEQIKKMSMNGMEFGSHSYSHPFLENLNYDDIHFELEKSKERIEEITSETIISFAPPGGWYNNEVLKAAKAVGYEAFFGCEIGINDMYENPFIYKRIEVFGNISNKEFKEILEPANLLEDKIIQSVKFFIHDTIGINNYKKIGNLLNN